MDLSLIVQLVLGAVGGNLGVPFSRILGWVLSATA